MTAVVVSTLAENERVIEKGLSSFVEVGNALMRIRDGELYREAGFDGFVEYLDSKPWGIGKAHAYRAIAAGKVARAVSPIGETIPESQARELAPLMRRSSPEVVKQVYEEASAEAETAGKKLTASALKDKVQSVLPRTEKKQRSTKADYNRKIDEEVIPALKNLRSHATVESDWQTYSQTTLKGHIKLMEAARADLDQMILQAQTHLGQLPSK